MYGSRSNAFGTSYTFFLRLEHVPSHGTTNILAKVLYKEATAYEMVCVGPTIDLFQNCDALIFVTYQNSGMTSCVLVQMLFTF